MNRIKRITALLTLMTVLGILHISDGVKADTISDGTDAKRVYSIVVDRFLNGDEGNDEGRNPDDDPAYPFGGDFRGIESELEYISSMGFDTIHLSPVFEHESDDYLGYQVTDYTSIEESFGGEEGFRSLIEAAHDYDIEVIVDVPVTATEEYETLDAGDFAVNELYQSYIDDKDLNIIDLNHPENQGTYREMLESFVSEYDVDGLSFFTVQDNVDAADFTPDDVTTYAVTTVEDMTVEGFDYTAYEDTRLSLTQAYGGIDYNVPEMPEEAEFLLADHWFSERFTSHAVNENMFPGTRVTQLVTYLYAYHGPISMLYGTEVALNGEDIPGIHRQMDLWTDQEIVEYMEQMSRVFREHRVAFTGTMETLHNEDGHYVAKFSTNDVDYILNVNATSETQSITLDESQVDTGKVMSGMLIGDMIRPANDEYIVVLDREETEFYAVVEEMGLNNGYIIASVLIFGGFGIFIFFAARNNKKMRNQMKQNNESK